MRTLRSLDVITNQPIYQCAVCKQWVPATRAGGAIPHEAMECVAYLLSDLMQRLGDKGIL